MVGVPIFGGIFEVLKMFERSSLVCNPFAGFVVAGRPFPSYSDVS